MVCGMSVDKERPDYGIDAPGVVRNLGLVGLVMLIISVSSLAGFLPKELAMRLFGNVNVRLPIGTNSLIVALAFFGTAAWILSQRSHL